MSYRTLGTELVPLPQVTYTQSWAERNRAGLIIGAGVVGLVGLLAFSWWAENRIEDSIRRESGETGVQSYRMARLGTSLMMMPLWWR